MKKLFMITMLFIGVTLTAQDSIPDATEALSLSEQIYGDAKEALKGLGESLQVGSEYVFTVLVKQQIVNSIVWLILLLISIIIIWICFVQGKDLDWDDDEQFFKHGFIVISGIVFTIIFISCLFHLDTIVTGFVNPEYGAMKEIMNLI